MTHRFRTRTTLTFCFFSLLLLMPAAANAGLVDIISLLSTVTSTLRNSIGEALNGIQTINTTIRAFEQQVVWPLTLIDEARGEVSHIRAQFSSLAAEIHDVQTNSAALANPRQLELLLRGQQSSNLSQISASYGKVYLSLPPPNQATVTQRNLVDIDDGFALGALKTAVVSDEAGEQMLTLADGLEEQAALSAPGSALILTAQAQAANLQNQAMLHKLLAAELRQEGARLAHSNALRKQSADAARSLRNTMQQILGR